jgi:predicted membrane-bound dolichyl-phosphate-mannose-protein mannosyltransferase
MTKVKVVAWLGALTMAGMIVFSLVTGDFFGEGSILLGMVWGQMSMVDLYVGFFLFYLWILRREKDLITKIIWFLLLMTTGSLAIALYILKAAYESKTELEFFLGK